MAIGLNPRRRSRRRVPPATVGKGGGVGFRHPSPKPGGGLIQPPSLTFDPAIEAQRQAAQRGLEDTRGDVKTGRHFAHTDLAEALRTIHTNAARKRSDITRETERGQRKLGYQEQDARTTAGRSQADLQTRAERSQADFHTQLSEIARKFGDLGRSQGEAANAAGVNDAGTQAASAAARGRNQGLAERPVREQEQREEADIKQAQGRGNEDLATVLSRIGTGREDLSTDELRAFKRLASDERFNTHRAKQEFGREMFELGRKLKRAIREGKISNADLLEQEIWQARENHPGAFRKWSNDHPGVAGSPKSHSGGKANSNHRRNR